MSTSYPILSLVTLIILGLGTFVAAPWKVLYVEGWRKIEYLIISGIIFALFFDLVDICIKAVAESPMLLLTRIHVFGAIILLIQYSDAFSKKHRTPINGEGWKS